MKNYKLVNKNFYDKISITCDKCHKEYPIEDEFEIQEFLHIDFTGGYGSIFGDMAHVECDICQHCLHEIIFSFCNVEE